METMYFKNEKNIWMARKWRGQCEKGSYLMSDCQGVKGHDGLCWNYGSDGSYQWSENSKELKPHEAKCGSIPPMHDTYVNPQEMVEHYYMKFFEDSEVTDSVIINRLEKGEIEDGESMMGGPISAEEQNELVDKGILEERYRITE